MIKVENVEVYGWEAAIRGMRNPKNSYHKSDSEMCKGSDGFEDCTVNAAGKCPRHNDFRNDIFCVGKADFELMKKLAAAGTDHRKFMRMINVTCDITAPMYWWKEFDTYKVGTVRNSCSTMHTVTDKEFTLDDFSHEHLDNLSISRLEWLIDYLNKCRENYIGDYAEVHDKKDCWWQIIQLLPSSYNQRATVQLNYEVLANMYHARKNHKLDCWRTFCEWIETLPYAKELICDVG